MLKFDTNIYGNPNNFPVSPDVEKRETLDNGFSAGWAMHFPPLEEYFTDMHCHLLQVKGENYKDTFQKFQTIAETNRVAKQVVVLHLGSEPFHADESLTIDAYKPLFETIANNKNIFAYLYLHYKNPNLSLLKACHQLGIKGVKLHNAPIIEDAAPPEVYESQEWQQCFAYMEANKLPVMWHVTQRFSASTYTGVGPMSYWTKGLQNGITYGNRELLAAFLKIVAQYKGIPFIAAHQLHMSFENLTALFDTYENLYSDTTVSCSIDTYDVVQEPYRRYYKEVFETYKDRLLFGTDNIMSKTSISYADDVYKSHIRFLKQLFLTQETLTKVAWQNAEKLFNL